MPAHGITLDAEEVTADADRLALLQNREVEAALVYGRVPNAYDDDVRAIMALWPRGVSSEDADPVQFLVHKDVTADVVYLVTKAMFEHANYFKAAHANLGIGLPSEAMTGLDIPLHAGAYRYYQESGFGLEKDVAADFWDATDRPSQGATDKLSATYSNFDDASLKPEEVDQIAAACRSALEMGSLSLVLGDLDNTGCEVYQDRLSASSQNRSGPAVSNAQAVAAFATSVQSADNEGREDSLFESPVGQGGPAIRWAPSDDDLGNRERDSSATPTQAIRVIRQPTM